VNGLFAARERVAELARGRQRGGAGSYDLEVGVFIGGDFQQATGVGAAVHFVKYQRLLRRLAVEE